MRYLTIKNLAEIVGEKPSFINQIFTHFNLLENNKPTNSAFEEEYVRTYSNNKTGEAFFVWDKEKIIKLIDKYFIDQERLSKEKETNHFNLFRELISKMNINYEKRKIDIIFNVFFQKENFRTKDFSHYRNIIEKTLDDTKLANILKVRLFIFYKKKAP